MSAKKFLLVFGLTLILLMTLVGQGQAQGQQPPPQPTLPAHPPSYPPATPPGMDEPQAKGQIPWQVASDESAQAVTLGASGTSFRYLQTFGVTEEPYLADATHLNAPNGMFIDGSDGLYVVEEYGQRMLKYDASGTNTLILGHAGLPWHHNDFLSWPKDVAVDGAGNIWVLFNPAVKKFDASGNPLFTIPATKPWESGNDNYHFNDPRGIAFDGAGRLFISDTQNHRIQVYDVSGETPVYLLTIGVTGEPRSDDTGFRQPALIAFDSSGRLYVVDTANNRVQRCTKTPGPPETWTCNKFFGVTGEGGDDLSHLSWAFGIGIHNDEIFLGDGLNRRVLKCDLAGTCSLFAGVSGEFGTDNAHLGWPADVSVDSSGNVFVSDFNNMRIQKFSSTGTYLSTIGTAGVPYVTDAVHLNNPWGIAVAKDGSFYVTERYGYRLVKINASGTQLWAVGQAGVTGNDNAHLGGYAGLEGSPAIDASGRVYVGDTGNDRVQIFNANGSYYATLGSGNSGTGNYEFKCPADVAISPVSKDIYVADKCNQRVQVFTSARAYKATLGATGTSGSDALHFNDPWGVTVDSKGNIYVADSQNHRIQKCNLIASAPGYACSTFAGETGVNANDFGHLGHPLSVKVDAAGRVYVADEWNNRIQVFNSSGAYLTTIGGNWTGNTSDFRSPSGIALDGTGNLYVADRDNHRIQKFAPGTPNWVQANINGFGELANGINSLGSFGGQLYAAAFNYSGSGAQLWRSSDGQNWSAVMTDGFGDGTNVGIDHLIAFNGKFYAGTWNGTDIDPFTNGGQIWRSATGNAGDWTKVVDTGFGDPTNGEIFRFAVFKSQIYASTVSYTGAHGTEIWRSATGDLGDWTKVVDNGLGDASNSIAITMEIFNGSLYAGTYSVDPVTYRPTGCEVWRSATGAAGDWTRVVTNGFGDVNCSAVYSLSAFGDSLYAGTSIYDPDTHTSPGGLVWRCTAASGCDEESDWSQVNTNGFGQPQNTDITSLRVMLGQLYAVTRNNITGLEVWRTPNGADWEQVGFAGFGNKNNRGTYWDNSATVFNNRLFIGTAYSISGGEIWRDNFDHGKTTPPSVPPLAAPLNNALITDTTPLLDWKNSKLPKGVIFDHYQLQVATDKTFSPTLLDMDFYSITNSSYQFDTELALNTKYFWRVRAFNLNGNASPWSGVRTFRIALPAPISLSSDGSLQNLRPKFTWDMPTYPAPVATGYTVQVSKTPTFAKVILTGKATGMGYTPTTDLPRNLTLYWRVRANGTNGPSAWSANGTVTTGNPPSIPALVAPANNALVTTYTPLLDWSNSTVLLLAPAFDHYVVQVADNAGFTSPVVNQVVAGPATNSFYTPVVPLAASTKFYWHVHACNINNECSAWSAVRSFRTK
jgi:hypothetical protein